MIATLTKKIRARMDEHPAIAINPRFSALFGELSRRGQRSKRVAPSGIDQEDQSNMPALELNTPAEQFKSRRAVDCLFAILHTSIILAFLS